MRLRQNSGDSIRILVDSLADEGLTNAQMTNAREIIRRLDPQKFHVAVFHLNSADPFIAKRPNTRLIQLPRRKQTVRILKEFVFGNHAVLFYVKGSPASKYYLRYRKAWNDRRITIGTMESQSDGYKEPTISAESTRLWEQTVLRCDFLFSNSENVRNGLLSEYGLSSRVVPTGVDTKFFTPCERPAKLRPRVLFAGSLRPFKQPQLLLDAASVFREADFIIAGDGIMAAELLDRIQRQNLTNVTLLGSLSPAALKQQYQKADIFLFPSGWEGSPKVILEAAACGLPVIARKDYQPETVVDGETGYLVGSDEELYGRLRDLLNSSELRQKLGFAGRILSEKFDWDLITHQWEEIFLSLSGRKAGSQIP